MKKVLWFSRHKMTDAQFEDLQRIYGDVDVVQVDGTAPNVHVSFDATVDVNKGDNEGELIVCPPLKELVQDYDVVAAVLPTNLKEELLKFMGDIPLIKSVSKRVNDVEADGETKYKFVFEYWQQIKKIEVVTERL